MLYNAPVEHCGTEINRFIIITGDNMTNSESNYVAIIREICAEEGIELQSFSFDWIFRLTKNGKTGFILGYQFGLNSASVNSICCDKSAASELMTALGIPNISHILFASPPEQKFVGNCGFMEELLALLKKHRCLVVKPNDGTGGDRVYKVTTPCELETAVFEIFQKSAYLAASPFEKIENEYRAVILDGEVRLLYTKKRPSVIGNGKSTVKELLLERMSAGDLMRPEEFPPAKTLNRIPGAGECVLLNWRHNLGQGARALPVRDKETRREVGLIARRVFEGLNVRFASVDVVETAEGLKVLEINSGVMMENFAGQDEESRQIAKEIYRDAIRKMMSN